MTGGARPAPGAPPHPKEAVMARPRRLLIVGLGNVLWSDDGLGAAAVSLLERRYEAPEEVALAEGATLDALLPLLAGADDVILIDAVRADAAPGSIVRLAGETVPAAVRERLSPREAGLADLLEGMRAEGRAGRLVLLGLVPGSLERSAARSPAIEAALPRLVEAIAEEARWMSHDLLPREDEATADLGDRGLACLFGV
jgi:hydrogenase maturation protease